jgi:hypothetical protein
LCQTYLKEKPCPSSLEMDSPRPCGVTILASILLKVETSGSHHTRRDGDLFLAMLLLVLRCRTAGQSWP